MKISYNFVGFFVILAFTRSDIIPLPRVISRKLCTKHLITLRVSCGNAATMVAGCYKGMVPNGNVIEKGFHRRISVTATDRQFYLIKNEMPVNFCVDPGLISRLRVTICYIR